MSIQDQHYPPQPEGPLARRPRPRGQEEKQFLAIGPGAEQWLRRAAGEGVEQIRRKVAEAVDLAKIHDREDVNRALEAYARAGRFAHGDLARVLAHHQRQADAGGALILFPRGEDSSLQASTRAWEGLGR